jgi:hypothetical protein
MTYHSRLTLCGFLGDVELEMFLVSEHVLQRPILEVCHGEGLRAAESYLLPWIGTQVLNEAIVWLTS